MDEAGSQLTLKIIASQHFGLIAQRLELRHTPQPISFAEARTDGGIHV